MRKIAMLILFAILLMILSSCGGDDIVPAKDVVNGTVAAFPEFFGDPAVFSSKTEAGRDGHITEGEIYALYFGDKWDIKNCGELEFVDDWCAAFAKSNEVRELHVFHAKSSSHVTAIMRMAEFRARTLSSPELFAAKSEFFGARPSDVRVFSVGKYVVLCAGGDCSALENHLRGEL